MGCCTNFLDFCNRAKIQHLLRRDSRLHFIAHGGRRNDFRGVNWLPAPLHLAPSFLQLTYLTLKERVQICRGLLRLSRVSLTSDPGQSTIGEWLRKDGQTERAIRCFWEVVLVSALAESLDRASLAAARKVFVDGFLNANAAYEVYVPTVPLQQLYDQVASHLSTQHTSIHLSKPATSLRPATNEVQLVFDDGSSRAFDFVIVAVPWRRVADILPPELSKVSNAATSITSSPITSLHLWFDRSIMSLPHAVLIDRLSQWIFAAPATGVYYYQVVISASRDLAGRNRESVLDEVLQDLCETWPDAKQAELIEWRMITEQHAVFSVTPETERQRPPQQTDCPRILLAGDWTQTDWPATMEGAVRSGYLAAEAILSQLGIDKPQVVPALEPSWLARWLRLT